MAPALFAFIVVQDEEEMVCSRVSTSWGRRSSNGPGVQN